MVVVCLLLYMLKAQSQLMLEFQVISLFAICNGERCVLTQYVVKNVTPATHGLRNLQFRSKFQLEGRHAPVIGTHHFSSSAEDPDSLADLDE